ncbi:hypothetical protein AAHC03_016921 [Spirometra sp. Aus1]
MALGVPQLFSATPSHRLCELKIDAFIASLPSSEVPRGEANAALRQKRIRRQIPPQDRKPAASLSAVKLNLPPDAAAGNLDGEIREATRFQNSRNRRDFGLGRVDRVTDKAGLPCAECSETIGFRDFCVRVRPEHRPAEANDSEHAPAWHPGCFRCSNCTEHLVDFAYAWLNGKPYCLRHYGQMIRPRCATCDHVTIDFYLLNFVSTSLGSSVRPIRIFCTRSSPPDTPSHEAKSTSGRGFQPDLTKNQLIFSEEYTRAMDQEHHTGHFACRSCDVSLTGQRYILRDEEPHCLACYEAKYANTCEQCKEKIGCDSKDLSFKERHWHEKCFKCSTCFTSLADRPFATKEDQLYCSDCYDERFAARCDGCQGVFKAGMRKYEYRGQQWHEECFVCVECKQPIGAKSFIPRENQVVCVPCYEAKYAQRCTKCTEVIRRGGVTYKGNPWHKECFTCTSCGKQLAGLKFTSKDEQPYCADCYGELFAKKCTKCSKPITGFGGCKFISFEDRHWHSECFACSKCNCNLVGRGFLTNEDQIMCSDCGR